MTQPPRLLIDVGSTVIKVCRSPHRGYFEAVECFARKVGVSPEDQVRALINSRGVKPGSVSLRICSSANGGLRVGVVGLSQRHSVEAAARAATAAGAIVVYETTFADVGAIEWPRVNVLLLSGGVDGGENTQLRASVQRFNPASTPHDTMVWAGAADVSTSLFSTMPDRVVSNVLDGQIRPVGEELTAVLTSLYLSDLIDARGLGSLRQMSDLPVWPTPAVVSAAVEEMTLTGIGIPAPLPVVIIDVGGTTTDVHHNAELVDEDFARSSPFEPVVRHVFSDLGVSASHKPLLARLTGHPMLFDFLEAVEPDRSRERFGALGDGDATVLDGPLAFLGCLFISLAELVTLRNRRLDISRAAGLVVTGGAWRGVDVAQIRRVVDLASGRATQTCRILVDEAYRLWLDGLDAVDRRNKAD